MNHLSLIVLTTGSTNKQFLPRVPRETAVERRLLSTGGVDFRPETSLSTFKSCSESNFPNSIEDVIRADQVEDFGARSSHQSVAVMQYESTKNAKRCHSDKTGKSIADSLLWFHDHFKQFLSIHSQLMVITGVR
jgi:hypothetical protein